MASASGLGEESREDGSGKARKTARPQEMEIAIDNCFLSVYYSFF
jgi:hypothetical protein